MSASFAGPSRIVARQAVRTARTAACPACLVQRRYASDDANAPKESWLQRGVSSIRTGSRKIFAPISDPYIYNPEYARKARDAQYRQEPTRKPFYPGSDAEGDDKALGTVTDQGVEIRPERLWKVQKRRRMDEQLPTEHRFVTPLMAHSPLGLGYICTLIRGMPVEEALLQLQFLAKRYAPVIRDELFAGYLDAVRRGLDREKLVVAECSTRQARAMQRIDMRAFHRIGIIRKRSTRIVFILREGLSPLEMQTRKLERDLRKRQRVGGAMAYNRDKSFARPLYHHGPAHRW